MEKHNFVILFIVLGSNEQLSFFLFFMDKKLNEKEKKKKRSHSLEIFLNSYISTSTSLIIIVDDGHY
jgi:hypothetical protein